jgi:membrane-bound lytic murein transglycosylase B
MAVRNKALLRQVSDRYGVPPGILVAIWGLESNYGRFAGVRPTIGALATLAWDPRRSTMFRNELLDALEILDRGDIDVDHMRGSWAGAMGQPQFMPSSYLKWAEDFDGDGRRDIWSSPADVLASIANFLKGHGWTREQRWGQEVTMTKQTAHKIASDVERRNGSCVARRDMTVALPLAKWRALGVRFSGGGALPRSETLASLVSGSSRHFLVYDNYDALLEYNCAHSYAIAVGLLSDRIE